MAIDSTSNAVVTASCTTGDRGVDARHQAGYRTVGETYFFREPASLDLIRTHVLPALMQAQRDAGRRLRLWSAGCSTGEEAYTLAMLLEFAIPDLADWEISLLATDGDMRALQMAQQGAYSEWSFRAVPQHIRQRFFMKRSDGLLEVMPRLRDRVHFAALDLAADAYPSDRAGDVLDLILCRNVLTYYPSAQAVRIMQRLGQALRPGGWLVLGAAEQPPAALARVCADSAAPADPGTASLIEVMFASATLYRKAI